MKVCSTPAMSENELWKKQTFKRKQCIFSNDLSEWLDEAVELQTLYFHFYLQQNYPNHLVLFYWFSRDWEAAPRMAFPIPQPTS